jgi:hypothetical protein
MGSGRLTDRLLAPLSERWVIRYTLLAYLGLACLGIGLVTGARWLAVTGIALCGPFVLWCAVFLGVLAPVGLTYLLIHRRRDRV